MESEGIQDLIEQIAAALVLTEASDLQELADLHTQFLAVAEWAAADAQIEAGAAAQSAAALLEGIITDDTEDGDAALAVIGAVVAALQEIIRDGRDPAEVEFPPELGLSSGGGDPAAGESPAGQAGGLSLPANVDEAIFSDFLARQGGVLLELEEHVLSLEKSSDEESAASLRRVLHTLKGEAGMLGLADVERLCHSLEDAIAERPFSELVDPLLSAKDWLARTFDAYAGTGDPPGSVDDLLSPVGGTPSPTPGPATQAPAAKPSAEPAAQVDEELVFEARPLDGDTDLMGDFVIEANEHLDNADVHLLTLETTPTDEEAINAVFRAFHTIKGVAGFMNLGEIQVLSHESESLLDRARKGTLELSGPVIDVTFDAVDSLKQLVKHLNQALSTGGLLEPLPNLPELITSIRRILSGEAPAPEAKGAHDAPDRLGDLLVDRGAVTEGQIDGALAEQAEPPEPKRIGEILVENAVLSSAQVGRALEAQSADPAHPKVGEILVEMGDATSADVEKAREVQDRPPTPPKLGETLVRSGAVAAKEVAQALRAQAPAAQRKAVQVREAVKVDSDRLDRLVDAIGELVIAESMVHGISLSLVGQGQGGSGGEAATARRAELTRHLGQLEKITRELQEMGTSLRMVPVRPTFQKMARLVRDLAKKSGKAVEFVMVGEDTELDKTVVDKIGDPLVHMVRNAVDHGIEATPADRVSAGKSATALVALRAFHKGGSIYVQIEDDGRGLDREVILAKAVERGLATQPEGLSDREVWNLIFEPGFSTAKEVTDVSGRGVGMDVVRRNIEALRGQVEITSEKGKGSVFTIRLPLTLAIIDGMVVRVGAERYVIPTLSIVTSVRPEREDISTVLNRDEMLKLQGELLPLFHLSRLFGVPDAIEDPIEGIVVVVESDGRRTGIMIDEILGQQQIVIKSLGDTMQGISGLSGGAIMPDGEVGLILDVGGLIRLACEEP